MICTLLRKPLTGGSILNALPCAVMNIDACRVGTLGGTVKVSITQSFGHGIYGQGLHGPCVIVPLNVGRFPANVIHFLPFGNGTPHFKQVNT